VIHFRTPNPLNEFYGQPPLMAAAGRVDIDNFMKSFVKTYFNKAGVPGGLLSLKGKISADARTEIKDRFKDDYGGPSGWHKLLVIDQDATFTAMTSNLGASGLVIPELDKVSTRRICTVFGVPPSLVGVDESNTSYASLEMIQRFFWDNTLAPLYKDLAATLNLRLVPNFPTVSEVKFDMKDVAALQEDVDEVHARERADLIAGGITIEEFRLKTGRDPMPKDGTFLIPANNTPVPVAAVVAGTANEVIKPVSSPVEVPA
jgi:HK97 family phage portal protein